jgi:hypothetical protein
VTAFTSDIDPPASPLTNFSFSNFNVCLSMLVGTIQGREFPDAWSIEMADRRNRLLSTRDPGERFTPE